jgi:hypothetical protein
MTKAIYKYEDDAAERIEDRIQKLERRQDFMKKCNAAIRKGDDETLRALGLSEQQIEKLKTPDFCGRIGFPAFELTNNNANIRRLKGRVKQVEKEQSRSEFETECLGATIRENPDKGSTEIVFGGKPERSTLDDLKLRGWRYAPSSRTWYKQRRDDYTIQEAKQIIQGENLYETASI